MNQANQLGPKLREWGGYLKACQTNEQLTAKAADLAKAMLDADAMREAAQHEPFLGNRAELIARADGLLTEAEYRVLCGIGKQRRDELKGQQT